MVCVGTSYSGSDPATTLVLICKDNDMSNPDSHRRELHSMIQTKRRSPVWRRVNGPTWLLFLGMVFAIAVPRSRGDEGESARSPGISLQNAILKTIATVTVAAEAKGVLEAVPIDIGANVVPGDRLATIGADDIVIQLERAQLELTLAQQKSESEIDVLVTTKSAAVAENEYLRALAANRSVPNTYPPNEIDRLKLVFERTQLEVRRAEESRAQLLVQTQLAENQVAEIEISLRKHTITAPTDGVVVSVEHHAGEWVEPGTLMATIVNLERLRVEGFVDATASTAVKIGDRAQVEVQYDEQIKHFDGRVVFVSPDVNSVSDLVRVFVDVDNRKGQLRPGLRTTVSIHGEGT